MLRKTAIGTAVALALAGTLAVPSPAAAGWRHWGLGLFGLGVGAALLHHHAYAYRPFYRSYAYWPRHRTYAWRPYYRTYAYRPVYRTYAYRPIVRYAHRPVVRYAYRPVVRYRTYAVSSWTKHAAWCDGRYRSYNVRTNAFLGFDGRFHRCNSPFR